MPSATSGLGRGQSHWAGPYGPLWPRRLLGEVAVLVVAEALLLRVYGSYDSSFHWAAHFLVGLIAATAWLGCYLLLTSRPAQGQVLMVLPFHLYAMFPDLLYRAGIPHAAWSNAFLAHVDVHYIPGGDRTWLVLASASLLSYAWVLSRWVAARTAEVEAGMPPGIGIGGSAVWTPQQDPARVPLHHRRSGAAPGGPGPSVLLLHGLGATGAVFGPLAHALTPPPTDGTSRAARSVVVPDLSDTAGPATWGPASPCPSRSPPSGGCSTTCTCARSYWSGTRTAAPSRSLSRHRTRAWSVWSWCARRRTRTPAKPPTGSPAGPGWPAARWPAPRRRASSAGPCAYSGQPCNMPRPGWHRPAAGGRPRRSLALLPGLPRCAALRTLLTDNPLPAGIRDPHTPTTVVIGDQDMTAPVRDVLRLPPGQDVGVTMLAGTHLLLLENPTALAREIRRATLL